jgi:hypothetical protein
MLAMRTPPGSGEETSRNPQDSPDGSRRRFLSQLKATYQVSGGPGGHQTPKGRIAALVMRKENGVTSLSHESEIRVLTLSVSRRK